MRKVLVVLVLLLLFISVEAQEPVIWLPLIYKWDCGGDGMGYWKVVVAEATRNRVLNPSGGAAGNFAAVGGGGAAVTRSTTYQRYGLYSYHVVTTGDNEGGSWTLLALANAIHYMTFRVRGTLPTSWDCSVDNANYSACTLIESLDSNWSLYGYQFPAAQCNGSTTLYIRQNGAGSGDFYIDGIQIEEKEYWTSYVDGDQEGCYWDGAEHGSTSSRSASSAAGGRQKDLEDDYYFDIGGMIGLGMAPQTVIVDEYALLPGGEINFVKVHPRIFSLLGVVRGTSLSNLQGKLNDLEAVVNPNTCPIRLRYTGSTVHKEIAACYESGMEGNIVAEGPCYWQKMAIQFIAEDPYFYSYGGAGVGGAGEAAVLDTNDSATFINIAGRLRSTGRWSALDVNLGGAVHAIVEDDTYIYIGGSFQNWDNIDDADRIARYNKETGVWSALGTGMDDMVRCLLIAPDGRLYAGGDFTTAGGGAANRIAVWDGAAWAALGAGFDDLCAALAMGLDGTLYAAGQFTTAGGGGADCVAAWDGAAWSALGTGTGALTYALAISLDGTLYAGGYFTTGLGDPADYVAVWDGVNWTTVGSQIDGGVRVLLFGPDGILYAGGAFTTGGTRVAAWNGTIWTGLGDGVNDTAYCLALGADDTLWVGGAFTSAGGITLADNLAKWNGASWAHPDINLPGVGPSVFAVHVSDPDPVVKGKYDIWIGFSSQGTGYIAGTATVTNNGTAEVYPVLVFERSGGTTAVIETVRNETTGKELLFDYSLLDGEKLTIDLRPTKQSIISSMFGSRPDAILANSDMGDFVLMPGANQVTSFVNVSGAPTVTAYIQWQEAYTGL